MSQDMLPIAGITSISSLSYLGSVMVAVCLTRPQYVLRSYCDSGGSRFPGKEADMAKARPARRFTTKLSRNYTTSREPQELKRVDEKVLQSPAHICTAACVYECAICVTDYLAGIFAVLAVPRRHTVELTV